MPRAGPWFDGESELLKHISESPLGDGLKTRVVELVFQGGGKKLCVLTSMFGMLRDGGRNSNTAFRYSPDRSLTHALRLEVTKALPAGRELTYAKPRGGSRKGRGKGRGNK